MAGEVVAAEMTFYPGLEMPLLTDEETARTLEQTPGLTVPSQGFGYTTLPPIIIETVKPEKTDKETGMVPMTKRSIRKEHPAGHRWAK